MAAQSSPKKEKKFPVMTNNYKDVKDATRSRISKQDSKESSPIGVERNEPERKRNNVTEDYKCAQVHNRHGNTNVQPASPWLTRKRASPNGEILDFTCYKKKTDDVLLETENTGETSSSTDLITALATKLCRAENTILRLEQRLQASEKTCKRRSLKIAALEEELKNKQHGLSEDPSDPSYAMQQELMYLQAKSSRLEKQVQDMVQRQGNIWTRCSSNMVHHLIEEEFVIF
ncbi:uncharacterized protein [Periplaneta americana]|uniref:uncharacterized protein n=1 Tax=Periplaneta americana TaxID=6978 RepID=UPI0037E7FA72